jgi:hypothetical protein
MQSIKESVNKYKEKKTEPVEVETDDYIRLTPAQEHAYDTKEGK